MCDGCVLCVVCVCVLCVVCGGVCVERAFDLGGDKTEDLV
jgi:hypothetical protein